MRAFLLFLLNLALYARGDSNPQPLAAKDIIAIPSKNIPIRNCQQSGEFWKDARPGVRWMH